MSFSSSSSSSANTTTAAAATTTTSTTITTPTFPEPESPPMNHEAQLVKDDMYWSTELKLQRQEARQKVQRRIRIVPFASLDTPSVSDNMASLDQSPVQLSPQITSRLSSQIDDDDDNATDSM